MTTFIDTNILIYITQETSEFHTWAKNQLISARTRGPVIICDIVYSEFSIAFENFSDFSDVVNNLNFERLPFTEDALFCAGKAYLEYKKNGGTKANVLPDFLIGAQAEVVSGNLLTANTKDFQRYFPKLTIIAPS